MSQYSLLERIPDPLTRQAVKLLMDRLGSLEAAAKGIGGVSQALAAPLDGGSQQLKALADPSDATDAVTLQYLRKYVDAAILRNTVLATATAAAGAAAPGVLPPPSPGSGLTCRTDLAIGQPGGVPAAPNLRWFRGDMCGVNVPGLPAVAGGAADPTLLLTWFIDRYSPADQAACIAAYKARGYTHWNVSWADSRDGAGQTEAQFVATCQMLLANGIYPVVGLYSKVYDGSNPSPTLNDAVIAALIAAGAMPICLLAGEAELFFDPASLQAMIDHVTGLLVPAGVNCYIHFSTGVHSDPPADTLASVFWAANVGKLTGLCWQLDTARDCGFWQEGFNQLLTRLGRGDAGWPQDSGFGHPFDLVAMEYSASARFAGGLSEAQAQVIGNQWICAPAVLIPSGPYAGQYMRVQGFGNGGPVV